MSMATCQPAATARAPQHMGTKKTTRAHPPFGSSQSRAAAVMGRAAIQSAKISLAANSAQSHRKVIKYGKAIFFAPQSIFHVSSAPFGEEFRTSAILTVIRFGFFI